MRKEKINIVDYGNPGQPKMLVTVFLLIGAKDVYLKIHGHVGAKNFTASFLKNGVIGPEPERKKLMPGDSNASMLSPAEKILFFEALEDTFGTGRVLASVPIPLELAEAQKFFDEKILEEFKT